MGGLTTSAVANQIKIVVSKIFGRILTWLFHLCAHLSLEPWALLVLTIGQDIKETTVCTSQMALEITTEEREQQQPIVI
jgi:hypothetical protein